MRSLLSNIQLPAILALLTVCPAAGRVLPPNMGGAIPAATSQLQDSAVPGSAFCRSGCWDELPTSELPENCANDPLTCQAGAFSCGLA